MNSEIAFGLIVFGTFISLGLAMLSEAWVRVQRIKWHMSREKRGFFATSEDLKKMKEVGYDI